jgi:hypothetical protein
MNRHYCQPVRTTVATSSPAWLTSPLFVLLILALAVITAGCGTSNDDAVAPQSADAAHDAWITALREGDQDEALALTDPELPQREQFVRDEVNRMQEYLTSPASPTGALQNVSVEPVSDGIGRSVWQFASKRWCYSTQLINRDERWYVSRWGQTSVNCH